MCVQKSLGRNANSSHTIKVGYCLLQRTRGLKAGLWFTNVPQQTSGPPQSGPKEPLCLIIPYKVMLQSHLIYFLFLSHTFMFLHPNIHSSSYSVFRALHPSFPLIKLLSILDGPQKAGSVCFTLITDHYVSASLSPSPLPHSPTVLRGKDCILKIFKSPGPSIKPSAEQTSLCMMNPTEKLFQTASY